MALIGCRGPKNIIFLGLTDFLYVLLFCCCYCCCSCCCRRFIGVVVDAVAVIVAVLLLVLLHLHCCCYTTVVVVLCLLCCCCFAPKIIFNIFPFRQFLFCGSFFFFEKINRYQANNDPTHNLLLWIHSELFGNLLSFWPKNSYFSTELSGTNEALLNFLSEQNFKSYFVWVNVALQGHRMQL